MATLFQAEAAGMADGLTQNAPRAVPPQFSAPALADAYLEAYDRMRQSLRGCVPAPPQERLPPKIKPPAAAGKPAKAKKAAAVASPAQEPGPEPQTNPGMDGILDALLRKSAKEGIAA